jgi:hypothetical protein
MRRWLAWAGFLIAFAAWVYGVALILSGDYGKGAAFGVPAAFVLLGYAWAKGGSGWLPDGGGFGP